MLTIVMPGFTNYNKQAWRYHRVANSMAAFGSG